MSITELSASPTVSLASVWQVSSSKHPITSTAGYHCTSPGHGVPCYIESGTLTDSSRYEEAPGLIEDEGRWWLGVLSFVHNNLV